MRIGNVIVPPGAALAPMAGVTDMPFRVLCHRMGSAFAVSEMLSAKGYLYAGRQSRVHRELLSISPDEGLTALQLFGHEPNLMAEAAAELEDLGFAWIDLNMGCPAKKITSNADGCALMKNPRLAEEIVKEVVRRTKLPVTVKIRLGWDEQHRNGEEFARRLVDAGAAAITVHGRTREQFYAGSADWRAIQAICRAMPAGTPLIGNGDVRSARDALTMQETTGCSAVAIGRAAQGNPWVFRQISQALAGQTPEPDPTVAQRMQMARTHFLMEMDFRGERGAVLEMRKHIAWYLSGIRGSAQIRARVNALTSADAVLNILTEAEETLLDSMPAESQHQDSSKCL